MISPALLSKQYNDEHYNCSHFVADVWEELTGERLPFQTVGLSIKNRLFKKPLKQKQDPCIVMFRASGVTAHAGVYVDGMVLHLNESGVKHESVDRIAMTYDSVRYYA